MLTVLGWGVAGIALLNLVTMVALGVAYAWHDGLRPKLDVRRARQRAFERILVHSTLETESMMCEPINAAECWE